MFFGFAMRGGADWARAGLLYQALARQSRLPVFYEKMNVPDTVDGRFDLVCLHVFLVLHRLRGEGRAGARLGQALFDQMFAAMDHAVREIGIGDLSVPRHIKRMMRAFKGRSAGYARALEAGDGATLREVLRRNLYGTVAAPDEGALAAMESYVTKSWTLMAAMPYDVLATGRVTFAEPGNAEEESCVA